MALDRRRRGSSGTASARATRRLSTARQATRPLLAASRLLPDHLPAFGQRQDGSSRHHPPPVGRLQQRSTLAVSPVELVGTPTPTDRPANRPHSSLPAQVFQTQWGFCLKAFGASRTRLQTSGRYPGPSKSTSTFSSCMRSSISAEEVIARRSASSSGCEKKLRGHSLCARTTFTSAASSVTCAPR
jgi:hypothetical protein